MYLVFVMYPNLIRQGKDDNVPRQCHTLVHEEDGMRKLEEYNYHYAERHDTNIT